MSRSELTRRFFLQGSGSVAGSTLLRAGVPAFIELSQSACSAKETGATFETLSAGEGRELEAIAARILPTTDTPGAREAGAIWFIDKAYGSVYAESLAADRVMLADFQSGVAAAFPGSEFFSDLDEADQDAYLTSHQDSDFFNNIRFMALAGVFGIATWGGNRNDIGWKLVGMDSPPHAWTPPFGYYDAEYMEAQKNGE